MTFPRWLPVVALVAAGCLTSAPGKPPVEIRDAAPVAAAPSSAPDKAPIEVHDPAPAAMTAAPSAPDTGPAGGAVGGRAPVCRRSRRGASGPPGAAPHRDPQQINLGPKVEGRIAPEIFHRVIRARFDCMRQCYREGLARDPTLTGRVSVKFIVQEGGTVRSAVDAGSDLKDAQVVACVVDEFKDLRFPSPNGDISVTYPILFAPER